QRKSKAASSRRTPQRPRRTAGGGPGWARASNRRQGRRGPAGDEPPDPGRWPTRGRRFPKALGAKGVATTTASCRRSEGGRRAGGQLAGKHERRRLERPRPLAGGRGRAGKRDPDRSAPEVPRGKPNGNETGVESRTAPVLSRQVVAPRAFVSGVVRGWVRH